MTKQELQAIKADEEARKVADREAAEELTRRIATRTHVPNHVPVLTHLASQTPITKQLKVVEVYINGTLKVRSDGVDYLITIPVNHLPRPQTGETIGVVFAGDLVTLAKPKKPD